MPLRKWGIMISLWILRRLIYELAKQDWERRRRATKKFRAAGLIIRMRYFVLSRMGV